MNDKWRYHAIAILKERNYRWCNSWTSICDIGREYDGHIFTYEDYLKTEQAYVNLFVSMFKYLHAQKVRLIHLVRYETLPPQAAYDKDDILKGWHSKVQNNMSLSLDDLQYVVPLILRENMWGVIYHKRTKTYIRFGYDYYVYVNSPYIVLENGKETYCNPDFINMVTTNGLFIEQES